MPASTMLYASIVHCSSLVGASNARPTDGSATLAIVMSTPAVSEHKHKIPSVIERRRTIGCAATGSWWCTCSRPWSCTTTQPNDLLDDLLALHHGESVEFDVGVGLAGDVDDRLLDRSAGEGVWTGAGVVVGHWRGGVMSDVESFADE
jgi:hypothetical protein